VNKVLASRPRTKWGSEKKMRCTDRGKSKIAYPQAFS
jgi:hypothetical protein